MNYPISIENDYLRVQVFPSYGSKVMSVVDKADHFDLMFSYPREFPTKPDYDIDYADGWYAGWDECFPGIGKGAYPGHPYEDVVIPDHGELWGLPTRVQPASEGIHSLWHGIRFGYHFSRHLRLIGNTLEAKYEVENLAPYDFRFVWALHSLMTMTVPVQFAYTGDENWRLSHDAVGGQHNKPFTWPTCQVGEDVSKPSELPAGRGWKVFSVQPIDKPFEVLYPTRSRKLEISYESESDLAAYWGIWINTGGWAGHHHFAIEPTTGRRDRLAEALKDGAAGTVEALSTVRWTVRWAVFAI